jgi:hypothetical protein
VRSAGGEVLHQQRARALADVALDLRVAAEALRLLPHVLHRQAEAVGDPRRVRDAGGLAAGDHVELLEARVARERGDGEVDQLAADARVEDQLAAIDVHRARPAGGEDERLVREKQHSLHLQQHLRGRLGDECAVGGLHGRRGF